MNAFMHPMFFHMPFPAMKVWAYLVITHNHGYSGTPGMLWSELRAAKVNIGRRALAASLEFLREGGMISISRHGHHVEIEITKAQAA